MWFDFHKIVQILAYLAQKEWGKINYTKALKILFFADKLYLRKYGKLITDDTYSAMRYGPVAQSTYSLIRTPSDFDADYIDQYITKDGYDIVLKQDPDLDYIAEAEKDTIDAVFEVFGKYTYQELIELTHQYKEWKKY